MAATPEGPAGPPDQATIATASATAEAVATVGQLVEQDNADAGQFAGQIATVSQVVDASASATQQLDAADGLVGVDEAGRRSLAVVADAGASATVDQFVSQDGNVAGSGNIAQWAGQQTEVAQDVTADAVGAQQLGRTGPVDGSAVAEAIASSGNEQSTRQDALLGDGELGQWSGQLALVVQIAGSAAKTTQQVRNTGNVRATSSAVASDLSLAAQTTWQRAARSAGVGMQTAAQLAQIAQGAAADATTSQTVGSSFDAALARSDATALNRSIALQTGAQTMNGAAAVDIQDLQQEAIVVQLAYASSRSSGGIGGRARTVNCATIQQDASQGIGSLVVIAASDLTAFCRPPVEPAPAAALRPASRKEPPGARRLPTSSLAPGARARRLQDHPKGPSPTPEC